MSATQRICLVLAGSLLAAALGCTAPDEKRAPRPPKKDGVPEVKIEDPKAESVAKGPGDGAEDLPPLAYRRLEVTTTQGQKVMVAAEHDPWADAVVSFKPGDPAPRRSTDPKAALRKPDYKGTDDAADEKTYVALGHGGELVVQFVDNVLVDGPGDDLVVFEIGPAVEPMDVAISEDGKKWIEVGRLAGGKSSVDIGPFVKTGQRFRFVRITDAKAGLSNNSEWPGADIDAVGAINSLPVKK